MKKFIYLMTGLLLFSGELYSQSYGLQFSSHEAIPEKRTSLNLIPEESLCLNEDTEISFDLKFVPDLNAYFGYVIRLITTDNQNIDIVSVDKFGNFNFVIGESFSYAFKIDSSSLYGKLNHCETLPMQPFVKFFLELATCHYIKQLMFLLCILRILLFHKTKKENTFFLCQRLLVIRHWI